MTGSVLERLDAFARQQKRRWVADTRKAFKRARRDFSRRVERAGDRWRKASARRQRRFGHLLQLWLRKVHRPGKIALERTRNLPVTLRNLGRKAAIYAWSLRRPFIRMRSRRRRVQEKWTALKAESRLEHEIERIADAGLPIVVGPWVSEVGNEALYWIPFVRWFQSTYRIKPERMLVMSRGGAAGWYAGITPNQAEIFDYITPDEFARYNNARAELPGGTVKQLEIPPFERDLIDRARSSWGASRVEVLHPSLMYRLFQQFWAGNRPLSFLDEHTQFSLIAPPSGPLPGPLPDDYVAVKFYAAQSLQDTPDTRRLLRELLAGIAERHPVVLLDTGLNLDDHGDYELADGRQIISAREWLRPNSNLADQTRIIAGARAFVGTCGSIAWLAPMLGVDTMAVMTDVKFLNVHLHVARRVYRVLGAGRFTPFDLGALAPLGLGLSARREEPA